MATSGTGGIGQGQAVLPCVSAISQKALEIEDTVRNLETRIASICQLLFDESAVVAKDSNDIKYQAGPSFYGSITNRQSNIYDSLRRTILLVKQLEDFCGVHPELKCGPDNGPCSNSRH